MAQVQVIGEFKGKYEWLSNFSTEKPVKWRGVTLKSSEHAYQSEKTKNRAYKEKIYRAKTPAEAKKLASKGVMPPDLLRKDWEDVKQEVMYKVLCAKFSDPVLKARLLATGTIYLVEGNWWGDRYWGVCEGRGKNMLGKLLMKLRKKIREEENAIGSTG